ncbi:hypothetical protein PRIPAC_78212 [Pristionchus pacificus]|uniref:Uncharacterized protein n=1 Tax=Pristionchus pacificus TaxID=54126 RepID=A0A2A6CN04_PRIPA|nr:hypothetical protein PRIPAC_78212 [Pristionchus pacificus]|eukprot:PDM79582.1 hypothetical protein PRIPAC_32161 [Pristionchus pacificus]
MPPGLQASLLKKLADLWPMVSVSEANCYDRISFLCYAVAASTGLVTFSVISTLVSRCMVTVMVSYPLMISYLCLPSHFRCPACHIIDDALLPGLFVRIAALAGTLNNFALVPAMNATIPLSLQIHNVMRIARHILTVLSLISAIPTLTVIVLCANRVSQRYAILLGLIVIQVNSMIFLLLILDPLMLLPDTCMMRQDPLIPLPGGANLYFELWVGVTTMNVPLFFACFLERHQVNSRFLIYATPPLSMAELDDGVA